MVRPRLDEPLTPALRVREWSVEPTSSVDSFPVSAHERVEVAWIEHGAVLYRVGRQTLTASAAQAVLIPAGVEHRNVFKGGAVAGSVWLERALLLEVAEARGLNPPSDLVAAVRADSADLALLGRLLLGEARAQEEGRAAAVDALSEALAAQVLGPADAPGTGDHRRGGDVRIRRAVDLMRTCYAEPLTIDEIARTAGMSRFHFSRCFREECRASPYQFLIEIRLAQAARALERGDVSVTEAALDAGFSDLSRFSSMFQRKYGRLPSASGRALRSPQVAR